MRDVKAPFVVSSWLESKEGLTRERCSWRYMVVASVSSVLSVGKRETQSRKLGINWSGVTEESKLSGVEPYDLLEELAFLRKAEGFSASRLNRVGAVREVLGGLMNRDFASLKSRFQSAIHSLDDRDAKLLLDAFGLSDATAGLPTLMGRRAVYAASVDRKPDSVADREGPALERLAGVLLRGTYAQSPLRIEVPEMHGGIVYETTQTTVQVTDRMWDWTRERYSFVATFDEMDFLTVTRTYPAIAYAKKGGAFRLNTRPTGRGAFNDHFWHLDSTGQHDDPMRRDERYVLEFGLTPRPDDIEAPITNCARTFHHRSLLAQIRVQFTGEVPSTIWSYSQVSHFDQPGAPNETNRVALSPEGVATLLVRDVHGGLDSGIAWTWS